jgi:hypothetical protein
MMSGYKVTTSQEVTNTSVISENGATRSAYHNMDYYSEISGKF